MKLERVEIFGFKSFPQRTEIAFDRGITGIVGPNGSGKSNIADAIRWVLGEQSAKMLRGARMEDVIFSGTDKRKAMPYCEVSLVFDNEDRNLHSDYAQVMVTRRAYRNGDGEYLLNKAPCRLRDVLELFRDTGIGKEGYSIISQGRIDGILSARSEERRQIFEEAAGIVTFRERKEEAERKLQKTRENLCRVGDIVSEIEAGIGTLQEHAAKAQRFLALSERLRALEINVYLTRHAQIEEKLAGIRKLAAEAQERIAAHEKRLMDLLEDSKASEESMSGLNEKIRQAQAALAGTKAEFSEARLESDRVRIRMENGASELGGLQGKAVEIRESLALMRDGEAGAEDASAARQRAIDDVQTELSAETGRLKELLLEEEAIHHSLDSLRDRLLSAMNLLSDTKSSQARQQAMRAQVERRMEEMEAAAGELGNEEQRLAEALEEARRKHAHEVNRLQEDEKAVLLSRTALQAASQELAAKNEELGQKREKLAFVENRLALLEEMSRGYEGYFDAVKNAVAFASGDPDVYGVVARLIMVPKEFETAIDMILGSALQHIVTRNEEAAKRIIDHLRTKRLGRATFLPVSALRPRKLDAAEKRLLSDESCIGVASDLVESAEGSGSVADYLLGRTVIVRDLPAAIRLSRAGRQAFHVVTLDGDVLRAGGAMTGGVAKRMTTSLLSREREIADLKAEVGAALQALMSLREEQEILEGAFRACGTRNSSVENQMQEQRIAVARDKERFDSAEAELADVRERLRKTFEALEQLELAAEEVRKDLLNRQVETQSGTEQVASMEAQAAALQLELAESRKKLDLQREKVTGLQLLCSRMRHDADTFARDAAKKREDILALEAELAKNETRCAEIRADADRAVLRLREQERRAELASQAIASGEEALLALEDLRRKGYQRQQDHIRDSEQIHALKNGEMEKSHRNEITQTRLESEIRSMADYLWNSYGVTHEGALDYRAEPPFDLPAAQREAEAIKTEIRGMGTVNVGAIEEFARTKERYDNLVAQREDAVRAEMDLLGLIGRLLSTMKEQFLSEFSKLNGYFAETFSRLFGGGQGQLRLADEDAPLSCDIDVIIQPQGKKLQLLSLFSGGERTLTAIAILFAMLKLKPTPFCVLDEIEAALDEANIGHFADTLSEYAQGTQFIVITHRKGTMQRCDALYGVSMEEKGVSGMLSVDLRKYGA